MGLLAAGAIITGLSALTKAGLGLYNAIKGKKEYNQAIKNMPKYNYQESQYLGKARSAALTGLTEANDMTPFAQMLAGVTSRNVDMASRYAVSSQQMMGYANYAMMQEMEMLQQAMLNNTERKLAARQLYINTLMQSAAAEQEGKMKEFEYNKWIPSQMKLNMAASRYNMGINSIYGSLGDIVQVSGAMMQYDMYSNSSLGKLFEGKKNNLEEKGKTG